MNNITLMGRLVADPEAKKLENTVKTSVTIAVDDGKDADGKNKAIFVPIVAFGPMAKVLYTFFKKGNRILIQGRLSIRSYETKDGNKSSWTEVIISGIDFIEKKEDAEPEKKPTKKSKNEKQDLPFDDWE